LSKIVLSEKFKGYIAGAFLGFMVSALVILIAFKTGVIIENNQVEGNQISWEGWKEIENKIISDSQYNFQVMRDIFTPIYNDTVTVENAGYKSTVYDWDNNSVISEGGWCFWVNHTQVLNSYYFDNRMSYKVLFPSWGHIEVIN